MCPPLLSFFFFFNDTATTEIYTLSLHDALPIWVIAQGSPQSLIASLGAEHVVEFALADGAAAGLTRSEEHTSELQSQSNLVCRLLLEKKKQTSSLASDGSHTLASYRTLYTQRYT